MNLFADFNKILDSCDINITLKKKDDQISVMVLPKHEKVKVTYKAIVITDTAENLDKSFMGLVLNNLLIASTAINNTKSFAEDVQAKTKKQGNGKTATVPAKATPTTQAAMSLDEPDADNPEDNEEEGSEVQSEENSPQDAKKAEVARPVKAEAKSQPATQEQSKTQPEQEVVQMNLGEDW